MHRKPSRQRHLLALDLLHRAALERTHDRFAIRLAPPAPGGFVLEHRVEVVHADETEILRLAVHRRLEHATRATNRAEGHHDRLAVHRVADLVVIADELHWIRARLTIDFDPHNQP